jgi:hypothetical protein
MMDQIVDLLVELITAVDLRRASLLPGMVVIAFFSWCIVLTLYYFFGVFVPFLPAFLAIFLLWGGFWLISRHVSASSMPNDSPTQANVAPAPLTKVDITGADPWMAYESKQAVIGAEIDAKSQELYGKSERSNATPKNSFKGVDRLPRVLLAATIVVNVWFIVGFYFFRYFPGWTLLDTFYTLSCCFINPGLVLLSLMVIFTPIVRTGRLALVALIVNLIPVAMFLSSSGSTLEWRTADYNQVVILAESGQLQPDASGTAVLPAKYNGLSEAGNVRISGNHLAMEVEFIQAGVFVVTYYLIHTADGHVPYRSASRGCYPVPGYSGWYHCEFQKYQ